MGLYKSRTLTDAKRTADKYFSLYIRLRDANDKGEGSCITCGSVKPWRDYDCGHFQSRRYLSTRYEENNAHAQCVKCNNHESGEQYMHAKEIDLLYGNGTADYLEEKARNGEKMSKDKVMKIAREYKEMAEEIAEIKGIDL